MGAQERNLEGRRREEVSRKMGVQIVPCPCPHPTPFRRLLSTHILMDIFI